MSISPKALPLLELWQKHKAKLEADFGRPLTDYELALFRSIFIAGANAAMADLYDELSGRVQVSPSGR
jgi:hypothetical protein